jgi:hypothetical protein
MRAPNPQALLAKSEIDSTPDETLLIQWLYNANKLFRISLSDRKQELT